jgi:hypothetical protein
VHAVKAYGGSRDIDPLILNLYTKWKWLVSLTPRSLGSLPPGGKSHWYRLGRRLDGPQGRSGHFAKQKDLLHLPGVESRFLGCPSRRLLTLRTVLPGRRRWEDNIKINIKVLVCNRRLLLGTWLKVSVALWPWGRLSL